MLALFVVLCCGLVAVFLQGCGSSGSSTTCLASQLDLVSQSVSGSMTGSVSISMDTPSTTVTTTMPVSGEFKEMLDLEQFNMYVEQTQDISVAKPVQMAMHVESKSILIAGEKKAVTFSKVTNKTDGKVLTQDCLVHNLTSMPTPANLSILFKTEVMPLVRALATCGGNDGTYDTWKIDKSYDGPVPNIPGMPPNNISTVSGSVSEKVVMTKDSLLHSAATTEHIKAVDKDQKVPLSMDADVDITITDAKAGGPSTADLDYSSWGKCKPASDEVHIDHLFEVAVEGFRVRQTYLQQHVISTIKAAMKVETDSTQSVVV